MNCLRTVSNLGSSTGADIARSIQASRLFPQAGYRDRCLTSLGPIPADCGSICRSTEVVFRGPERTLQLLACADLHPSDYASEGGAEPLAANDPMVLVGRLDFGLPGRWCSRAVGAARSTVASGSSRQLHAEARAIADCLAQTLMVRWIDVRAGLSRTAILGHAVRLRVSTPTACSSAARRWTPCRAATTGSSPCGRRSRASCGRRRAWRRPGRQ